MVLKLLVYCYNESSRVAREGRMMANHLLSQIADSSVIRQFKVNFRLSHLVAVASKQFYVDFQTMNS